LYDHPENSTFSKKLDYSILELIESDVIKYSEKGKIFLVGDFSARTATENDFIQFDSDEHIPLYNNYVSDQNLLPRDNRDKILSTRGRQLFQLCI
jgi:hypothetical protein